MIITKDFAHFKKGQTVTAQSLGKAWLSLLTYNNAIGEKPEPKPESVSDTKSAPKPKAKK